MNRIGENFLTCTAFPSKHNCCWRHGGNLCCFNDMKQASTLTDNIFKGVSGLRLAQLLIHTIKFTLQPINIGYIMIYNDLSNGDIIFKNILTVCYKLRAAAPNHLFIRLIRIKSSALSIFNTNCILHHIKNHVAVQNQCFKPLVHRAPSSFR